MLKSIVFDSPYDEKKVRELLRAFEKYPSVKVQEISVTFATHPGVRFQFTADAPPPGAPQPDQTAVVNHLITQANATQQALDGTSLVR